MLLRPINNEAYMLNIKIHKYFNLSSMLCAFSVIFLSACSEKQSNNNPSLNSLIQQGKVYKEQSQFRATMTVAQNAIKIYPEKIDGYLLLADTYTDLGSTRQAIDLLESYTSSKNDLYYFQLLENYISIGKNISALTLLRSHPQEFKKQPSRLLIAEGNLALIEENIREAFSYFNQIPKSDEYYLKSQIGIAKIEIIDGDTDTALNTLNSILGIDQDNIDALQLQSYIYTSQKKYDDAEKTLTHILPLLPASDIFTPQRVSVLQSIIQVLTLQGRSAEATLYTQILSTEMPQFATANQMYTQALNSFKNNDIIKSKSILNDILLDSPGYTKATTLLGVILYGQGNIIEAEKYLSRVVDPETNSKELTQLYLISQIKLNKSNELLDMLDDLITTDTDFDTLSLYAIAAIDQRNTKKAKKALELMHNKDPDSSQLAFLQSRYYGTLKKPNYEKSISILSEALVRDRDNQSLQKAYIGNLLITEKNKQADDYINKISGIKEKSIERDLLIAQYHLYKSDYHKAEVKLKNNLLLEPNNIDTLYTLARAYQAQSKWNSALSVFKKVIEYYPDLVNGYQGTITSIIQQGIEPELLTMSLPKNYNQAVLNLVFSNYLLLKNKLDDANELITKQIDELPIQLQEQNQKIQKQIAIKRTILALKNKKYQKSRVISVENISKNPDEQVFYNILAKTEIEAKQYTEATKVIEQIGARFPGTPLLNIIKADLAWAKGEKKQAVKLYEQSWKTFPDNSIATKIYNALIDSDKIKASIFLSDWLKKLPTSITANISKAMELQSNKQNKQAILAYEKTLNLSPNNLISLNNAAWLYIEHDIDRAEVLAKKAYKLNPNNPSVLDTYGWILFKKGKSSEAKDMIKSALNILPNDLNIKAHWIDVQN